MKKNSIFVLGFLIVLALVVPVMAKGSIPDRILLNETKNYCEMNEEEIPKTISYEGYQGRHFYIGELRLEEWTRDKSGDISCSYRGNVFLDHSVEPLSEDS